MNDLKFAHEVEIVTVNCSNCGCVFAMSQQMNKNYQNSHEIFYCPKGHPNYYPGKSHEEKLRAEVNDLKRQVQRKQKETEWAEHEIVNANNRTRAQKAAKTRLKNKIAKGNCPCCDKPFKHLARHMKNKHPDFIEDGDT